MGEASDLTIGELFQQQARRNPSKVALEFKGSTWTYLALNRTVNQAAHLLTARGLSRGGRVGLLSGNSPAYLVLQLAAAKTGVAVACLNWRQADDELEHCVGLAGPQLVFVGSDLQDTGARLAGRSGLPMEVLGEQFLHELNAFPVSEPDFMHEVRGEDLWVILYTSGTTGWPKGAAISHRALIARSAIAGLDGGVLPDLPSVTWAPMFHMSGTDSTNIALLSGGSVILLEKYDADAITRLVTERDIGVLPLMPATVGPLIELLRECGRPIRPVGRIGSMADLIPPDQIAEVSRLLRSPFRNTFGSTETGLAPASKGLFPVGVAPSRLAKTQSSLCAVKLVDSDGNEVPDGDPGEVAIKGPSLFSGYVDRQGIDTSMFSDGWFRMGDMMTRTTDGLLDYVDRKKYLIKSGGENIYPAELERVLLGSPRILDAAVVREMSDKWGETPVAFVVARDSSLTTADVMGMFPGKLASYKFPKRIIFIGESDLPRNTTGKIQRHLLEKLL